MISYQIPATASSHSPRTSIAALAGSDGATQITWAIVSTSHPSCCRVKAMARWRATSGAVWAAGGGSPSSWWTSAVASTGDVRSSG